MKNTVEPHLGERIIYSGAKLDQAESAIILLHGRGSTAEAIIPLANELEVEKTIVIAPQATDFTWYPFRFIEKRERNEPGISSGFTLINSIINNLNNAGIGSEKIFLLGFSQGACLAVDYAARHPKKYGGIFVLSGGLIGDELINEEYSGNLKGTPIFLGCSDIDFHIPEVRVHESAKILEAQNAVVTTKIYKGMGHTIIQDELDGIKQIISNN